MSSFCSLSESNLLEAAIVLEEFCKASCINFILSLCLDVVVFKQQNQEQPQQKQIQVFSFQCAMHKRWLCSFQGH